MAKSTTNKKKYSVVNLFVRSCIFSLYMWISIPIYSLFCIASRVVPMRKRHALIRGFLHMTIYVLKKVCLVNYKIEGLNNVPKHGAAVVLCKHQSTWETFYLPLIFDSPAAIIKRELLWIPFFGWAMAVTYPIAINRNQKKSAMQQIITQGRACLEDNRSVLVFPEGTRMAPGVVGHYKLGGARLAVETGYPVIPVAHNAGRCWPRRKFIKQPGTIRMVIGPAIQSTGRTAEEVLRLAKEWIEETMIKIDG